MVNKLKKVKIILFFIFISLISLSAGELFNKAKKEYDLGKYNKAINIFKQEINTTESDDSMLSMYYLGLSYEKINKKQDAIKIYKTFIKKYPDKFLTETAINRLKKLDLKQKIDYTKIKTPKEIIPKTKSKNVVDLNLQKSEYTYIDELKAKEAKTQTSLYKKIKTDIENKYSIKRIKNKVRQNHTKQKKKVIETTVSLPKKENIIMKPKSNIEKNSVSKNEYIVKKGETLYDISNKIYGSGKYYKKIGEYNKLKDITSIYPGQHLLIPDSNNKTLKIKKQKEVILPKIKIIEKSNVKVEAIWSAALNALNKKYYLKALRLFDKYNTISIDKTNLEKSYYYIAIINHLLGRFEDAIASYTRYIEKFKNNYNVAKAYLNLGNLYYEGLGIKDEAEKNYILFLKYSSNFNLRRVVKDKLSLIQAEESKGEKSITSVKNNKPITTEILIKQKKIIKLSEINNKPKKSFDNKVKLSLPEISIKPIGRKKMLKQEKPSLASRKIITLKNYNTEEKHSDREFIKDMSEKSEDELLTEAYKNKQIGMYEEAIKIYKTLNYLYPNNATAYNNLAFLYIDLNTNLNRAIQLAKKALRLDPLRRGYYLDTLGWAYYKKGDYMEAQKILEKSLFYQPTAERKYHLAMVYKELNYLDKSLTQLNEALIIKPKGKLASKIKNEIYRLEY